MPIRFNLYIKNSIYLNNRKKLAINNINIDI